MLKRSFNIAQKAALFASIPALVINLTMLTPMQASHAAWDHVGTAAPASEYTTEESDNMSVYQQNAPAVVSISSGQNQGAGVILSAEGLLVTNKHVIENATIVSVKTSDNTQYKAKLVTIGGFNKDLAFLKIQSQDTFPYVKLGDSSTVRVGQRVYAIGSPFGLDGTMTTGIVSRIDHTRNMLQTDAAINPGNSGGALLNRHGELIGINRSIVNPVGASSAGISFAVPVNVVKQEVASLGLMPHSTVAYANPH